MIRSFQDYSTLLHCIARRFHSMQKAQVYKYLLLTIPTFLLLGCVTSLETDDVAFINFHPQYNNSEMVSHQAPLEEMDVIRVEEINEQWKSSSSLQPMDSVTIKNNVSSRINGREGQYYYRRPTYLQIRSFQRGQSSIIEAVNNADKSLPQENIIHIEEISCRDTDDIFFRASIKFTKETITRESPVIDNAEMETCKVTKAKDEYTINFEKERFTRCGVTDCSMETEKFYCLDLRFPQISGLKLRDDSKITLRCKIQEKTATNTKEVRVKTLDTSTRMVPRVVTGGFKNTLQTDVGLFRQTFNSKRIFNTKIQSGGTIILGEEVLLRVLVRDGDGWRYSKINELMVHYMEKKQRKNIMNSLRILDANGCLNPDVREICSREQYRISPLESYLIFRAFMFENMKDNEEIVLTVKVMGCLEGNDCILNCPAGHNRRSRRSILTNNNTIDWENDISFRVAFPKEKINIPFNFQFVISYALIVVALVIIIALLCTIKILLRQRSRLSSIK